MFKFNNFLLSCGLLLAISNSNATLVAPPEIESRSHILMETSNNKVFSSENSDIKLPPASLTKLMTSYIVQEELMSGRISEDDMVNISVRAWKQEGSRMFIREGTQVSVSDLLHGVIIQSGNDAAMALAEYISGSEEAFADLMNATAKSLGMKNSHFVNSTGLPAKNHYSTAEDLAILADAIIEHHPKYYAIYSEPYFEYNSIKQKNRNKLLFTNKYVDGLKTGYTAAAKYGIVASSIKDGMRLISVVMGAESPDSRAVEAQKLFNYGHREYTRVLPLVGGEILKEVSVWGGVENKVNVVPEAPVSLIVRKEFKDRVAVVDNIALDADAPIISGSVAGKVAITVNGSVEKVINAVFEEDVEKASWFKVFLDIIKKWFEDFF